MKTSGIVLKCLREGNNERYEFDKKTGPKSLKVSPPTLCSNHLHQEKDAFKFEHFHPFHTFQHLKNICLISFKIFDLNLNLTLRSVYSVIVTWSERTGVAAEAAAVGIPLDGGGQEALKLVRHFVDMDMTLGI